MGIDFEKYGTKLPPLFEKKVDPEFYDQFHINKNIVNEYLKTIGWTELIPLAYILFAASLEKDPFESIKTFSGFKSRYIISLLCKYSNIKTTCPA